MTPGLTETHHTPKLLAELVFHYLLDWANDSSEFVQMVVDQYEQLCADSVTGPWGFSPRSPTRG